MNRDIINFPNLLTLSRILLTPFLLYMILEEKALLALAIFVVAGFTDMLDGLWAKRFHQQTDIGALLDPIADKLLLVSCMVVLFSIGQIPLYLFLAVIFRDVIIVVGAIAYELVTHKLKMQPSIFSKATTAMQIIYLAVVLLDMATPVPPLLVNASALLTFALTCISGLHYMITWTLKAMRAERA